jgi:hypothetical protein
LYKVLNLRLDTGPQQQSWINASLAAVTDHDAVEALKILRQRESDIGKYLFVSGRCAVAHAFHKPFVDPDDPDDSRRLSEALPLIRDLAAIMIESEFGVKRRRTIWREHLYELAGFKELLGPDLVAAVNSGLESRVDARLVAATITDKLPRLCIRVRGHAARPYEQLNATVVGVGDGAVTVLAKSDDDRAAVLFALDFKSERLTFDLTSSFSILDFGDPTSAGLAALRLRFLAGLVANGQLEVFSATGILLGRQDPYIPTNIDPSSYSTLLLQAGACMNAQSLRTLSMFDHSSTLHLKTTLLATTTALTK